MKTLISLIILVAIALSANANWLPSEIHEVRAYVYDYTQEEDNASLLKQGKLHAGIINDGGAKLSKEQIQRLIKALRSKEERLPGAFCYMPHHGFIFFDKEGKAMGHIELCFQCGNVESSPQGLPEHEWNWKELQALLEELKIPILKEDVDYSKLYTAEKAKSEQVGSGQPVTRPKPKSEGDDKPRPESEGGSQERVSGLDVITISPPSCDTRTSCSRPTSIRRSRSDLR